ENLMNLLEPDGGFWGLFTPWHKDDLNSDLKTNPAYALFRRAVEPFVGRGSPDPAATAGRASPDPADLGDLRSDKRQGQDTRAEQEQDEWRPVWPEKWPAERLAARRREIGAAAFARAYRLVCIPDEDVPIKAAWVQFWTAPVGHAVSLSGRRTDLGQADSLPYEQVILSIDPAVSQKSDADQTALVTLGKTKNNEIHCLEAMARRVSTPELVNLIDDADGRWQPDVILFETNAAFAGIKDLLMRHGSFGGKSE